ALEREIERIGEMAAELRQPRAMAFVPLHRGMLAVTGGRFAEAERLNAESLEIGRRVAGSVSQLAAHSQLQLIRLHQGRLPELEDLVRGMLASYPEIVALRCGLIALLLQADRPEEARVEFERVLGGGLGALPRNNTHILVVALLGGAAVEFEDVPRARVLYERLEPFRARWVVAPSACAVWPVERSLGQLAGAIGEVELALSHLASARSRAEEADALPSLALVALDEARILAARDDEGDAAAAARRAGDAHALGASLGMRRVADAAGALARTLGAAGSPRPEPDVVATLEHE
ncbi:MAG: hypothetical protein QOE44_2709, partial [Solirubrobacteraceae bacterium]|nr:hypothetical protein [Solirubrobacteraceae bacterium]